MKPKQAEMPLPLEQSPLQNVAPLATRVPTPSETSAEWLIAKAIDAGTPIEALEKLLAMRDRLKAEQAEEAYYRALSQFQAKCPVIPKTKTAGQGNFSYKYADLDVMVSITAPLLAECGLSVDFDTRQADGWLTNYCTVHHVDGHSKTKEFPVPIDKSARMNDTQKVAAANTYAKRQNYQNSLGIMTGEEDTDAQAAGGTPAGRARASYNLHPEYGSDENSGALPAYSVEDIRKLAREKAVPTAKICGHYHVEKLEDMTAETRRHAMEKLFKTPDPVEPGEDA